jgi:hypothetical protein
VCSAKGVRTRGQVSARERTRQNGSREVTCQHEILIRLDLISRLQRSKIWLRCRSHRARGTHAQRTISRLPRISVIRPRLARLAWAALNSISSTSLSRHISSTPLYFAARQSGGRRSNHHAGAKFVLYKMSRLSPDHGKYRGRTSIEAMHVLNTPPISPVCQSSDSPLSLEDSYANPNHDDKQANFQPLYRIGPVTERKLVRKLDLRLLPWVSLLYLISFLDRTNIGNAKILGNFASEFTDW